MVEMDEVQEHDQQDLSCQTKNEAAITKEEMFLEPKKTTTASAGVAELMKNLKPKKKGQIDKGKQKQIKIGSFVSRGLTSSSSL